MATSASPAVVEIAVQDPVTHHERTFRCALNPLRAHMRYFEPHLQRQLDEPHTSPSSALTLRARCDHATFQWLVEWLGGKAPPLTNGNVVSVCLSSAFLQMQELTDSALLYLSAHLAEVVSSSFDLTSLPMHLVLRLSHMVRDTDLAAALLRLHEQRSASHPNRAFVASLLQHYVCHHVGVADCADAAAESAAAVPPAGASGSGSGSGNGALTLSSTSGLRWCRLCASLFDEAEMDRLCRASPHTSPACPAHTAAAAPPPSSSTGACTAAAMQPTVCIGPRGELFTTHAAARQAMPVELEAPPPLRSGTAVSRGPSAASPTELERWAWRVLGACRFVGCRRCSHLVALLDTPGHRCSELPPRYSSPDNAAEDINSLVRWFLYCAENGVYEREGGLTPMHYGGPASVLATEVVAVPTISAAADASRGRAAAAAAADGGATTAPAGLSLLDGVALWARRPFYTTEVMSEGIVDIDILNYVERQHRLDVESLQRRASATQVRVPMRLSVVPLAAGGPTAAATMASSSSSPRPASSLGDARGGSGGGRSRAGNGGGARAPRPRPNPPITPYGSLTSTSQR
ncbi:hypothetical protein NESM_000398800 [Novymonas esmeraldas]|uniref:SANT and BTB domain-containing protein n=1 Tax=Novymonas esmeraldas TaxID=1808958 RepID=A0AAW0EKY6_9TRYP